MTDQRNALFLQHEKIVWWIIKNNMTLIIALQLEIEDVYQELAIAALKAIDKHDPSRGRSLSSYIIYKLRYEIINIRDRHKLHGLTYTKKRTLSFTCMDGHQDDYSLEILDEAPYDDIVVKDVFSGFSDMEQTIVQMRVEGYPLRKKVEKEALASARQKVDQYYAVSV